MDLPKKRVSSLSLSSRSKQPSISKRSFSVPCSKCIFCQQQGVSRETGPYFPYMINKALFTKYSSSQNYYYTRGLNEFLGNARTPNVIRFKDTLHFDEDEEYLKRFYMYSEYDGKIRMLSEYYKFHQDIARMFMLPLTNVVNRYHDRKRRLEYIRVTKMLRDQNQGKTSTQESVKAEKVKHIPLTDRVLADLDLTQSDRAGFEKRVATEQNERVRPSTTASKGRQTQGNKGIKDAKGVFPAKTEPKGGDKVVTAVTAADQSRDMSISHTIHELNMKLGEIISTSYSQNFQPDALSYFENSEQLPNDNTISNLNNFLDYIHVNQQATKFNKIPAIASANPSYSEIKALPNSSRSPDSEFKLQPTKSAPKAGGEHLSKSSKLMMQKQLSKEANLADDLLKKVSNDQFARNFKRATQNMESDRPMTSAATSSKYPSSAATTARSNNVPISSMRIQNFDEALRIRQQTSPPKIDSQRSTSREGHLVSQVTKQGTTASSLSHRAYDVKGMKGSQETKSREVLTSRRSSQTTVNSSELNTKGSGSVVKNKSIFNTRDYTNVIPNTERNVPEPISVYTSQNLNNSSRPNSHRDMRISLDIQALNRHMSQPGGFSNPSTATYTGKTISKTSGPQSAQLKIHSGPTTSMHEKSKSMKITPNPNGKDGKFLGNFGQLDFRDSKDSKSGMTSSSSSSKKGVTRSGLTSRGEYRSSSNMGIIPEQEIINMKYNPDDLQRKALTHREANTLVHHKYTKSEGKFAKIESTVLSKKSSLPQSAIFRDAEQAVYEDRRGIKEKDVSPSKQVYTYNHNNIVNIFVNPQEEKLTSEPNLARKGTGPKLEKDLSSSATLNLGHTKMSSAEVLIKYNNQNQARKTEMYDMASKYANERESSATIVKKEDPRLVKSKSGYGSLMSTPAGASGSRSAVQSKGKGKIELDLVEKKIKVSEDDDYEILLKFKGKKC